MLVKYDSLHLIDLENVGRDGTCNYLEQLEKTKVVIFYTSVCNNTITSVLRHFTVNDLTARKIDLEFVYVENGRKNALDFTLVTYLSDALKSMGFGVINIVSRDKGYESVIKCLDNHIVSVRRIEYGKVVFENRLGNNYSTMLEKLYSMYNNQGNEDVSRMGQIHNAVKKVAKSVKNIEDSRLGNIDNNIKDINKSIERIEESMRVLIQEIYPEEEKQEVTDMSKKEKDNVGVNEKLITFDNEISEEEIAKDIEICERCIDRDRCVGQCSKVVQELTGKDEEVIEFGEEEGIIPMEDRNISKLDSIKGAVPPEVAEQAGKLKLGGITKIVEDADVSDTVSKYNSDEEFQSDMFSKFEDDLTEEKYYNTLVTTVFGDAGVPLPSLSTDFDCDSGFWVGVKMGCLEAIQGHTEYSSLIQVLLNLEMPVISIDTNAYKLGIKLGKRFFEEYKDVSISTIKINS